MHRANDLKRREALRGRVVESREEVAHRREPRGNAAQKKGVRQRFHRHENRRTALHRRKPEQVARFSCAKRAERQEPHFLRGGLEAAVEARHDARSLVDLAWRAEQHDQPAGGVVDDQQRAIGARSLFAQRRRNARGIGVLQRKRAQGERADALPAHEEFDHRLRNARLAARPDERDRTRIAPIVKHDARCDNLGCAQVEPQRRKRGAGECAHRARIGRCRQLAQPRTRVDRADGAEHLRHERGRAVDAVVVTEEIQPVAALLRHEADLRARVDHGGGHAGHLVDAPRIGADLQHAHPTRARRRACVGLRDDQLDRHALLLRRAHEQAVARRLDAHRRKRIGAVVGLEEIDDRLRHHGGLARLQFVEPHRAPHGRIWRGVELDEDFLRQFERSRRREQHDGVCLRIGERAKRHRCIGLGAVRLRLLATKQRARKRGDPRRLGVRQRNDPHPRSIARSADLDRADGGVDDIEPRRLARRDERFGLFLHIEQEPRRLAARGPTRFDRLARSNRSRPDQRARHRINPHLPTRGGRAVDIEPLDDGPHERHQLRRRADIDAAARAVGHRTRRDEPRTFADRVVQVRGPSRAVDQHALDDARSDFRIDMREREFRALDPRRGRAKRCRRRFRSVDAGDDRLREIAERGRTRHEQSTAFGVLADAHERTVLRATSVGDARAAEDCAHEIRHRLDRRVPHRKDAYAVVRAADAPEVGGHRARRGGGIE